MAEADNLAAARILLTTSLENSRVLDLSLASTEQRLDQIKQRLASQEATIRPRRPMKFTFAAIKDQIDHAVNPVVAVIKVYDTIQELEKSLSLDQESNIFAYLSLVKQLEGALKFLADNCVLAIQWLEGILQFLEENSVVNYLYVFNVKKSLRILRELQATEKRSRFDGGIIFAAFQKLENEFYKLLSENSFPVALPLHCVESEACVAPSPLPVPVIQKLQAVVDRLNGDNRLMKCASKYIEVRSMNARKSLQALDLGYLEKTITEATHVQDIEEHIDKWCKHFKLLVKDIYEVEYKLGNDVFEKSRSDALTGCVAKIAMQSGFLTFLQFGKKVTECKKDPIKLLKLLDIFTTLENLRGDFNRLFGDEACVEIQNLTRELIRRVVVGACDIFCELPIEVELQRRSSPPPDGSVPKLVSFVTDYCNRLLGDNYKPILTQVLVIHKSWKQEKFTEGLVTEQICCVIREIGLNLDFWSKIHENTSLSYLFMMNNHAHFCNLKGTKLGELMGDSWLGAHEQYKDYYMALYLRESWGKVLDLIRYEGRLLSSPSTTDLDKKRLKAFNEAFDDMYHKQSKWVIADEIARLKMFKIAIQAIVPVYSNYLQNHGLLMGAEDSSPSKYVKYSAQGLESMLGSLFQQEIRKCGSRKHTQWVDKIKNIVAENLELTLMAA